MGGGKAGYEEIKLIDFGMTRVLDKDGDERVMGGTPEFIGKFYMASKQRPYTLDERSNNIVCQLGYRWIDYELYIISNINTLYRGK